LKRFLDIGAIANPGMNSGASEKEFLHVDALQRTSLISYPDPARISQDRGRRRQRGEYGDNKESSKRYENWNESKGNGEAPPVNALSLWQNSPDRINTHDNNP
jgi:hypothetical protein